jgi:hypothetical protein
MGADNAIRYRTEFRNAGEYSFHYHHQAGPSGRAVRGVGPDRLYAETVGSNPA